MNARLELLKEPQKQQAAMATLDLAARFTQGDRAVPLLQAMLFFLQKGGDEQRQGPEAQDGGRAQQLL